MTLPKQEIKSLAPGARSCEGNHHMSWVPYDQVTEKLILKKLNDKRSNQEIEADVYEGSMSTARQRYYEVKGTVEEEGKKEAKAKKVKAVAKETVEKKVKKAPKAVKVKVGGKLLKKLAHAKA